MGTVSTVALVLLPWLVVPTLMLLDWTWRELVPHRDPMPRRGGDAVKKAAAIETARGDADMFVVGEKD